MTLIFAGSTLLATLFVAMQAWYARVAFVEASQTRLLENKLDLCFENFDDAAALDLALRRPCRRCCWTAAGHRKS